MPVESATTISQLDDRYPLPSDPGSRGDDHLRLIKSALKKQFPGAAGNGFSKPITLTEDFLNGLPKMIKDLQDSMDKRWPVGTVILQTTDANPNGIYPGNWSLVTGDASLRLGDGTNNVARILGKNDQVVPLPLHNHSAWFHGDQLPEHSHQEQGTDTEPYGHGSGQLNGGRRDRVTGNTIGASAGTPSGRVDVDQSGIKDVTMNVRGAYLLVNFWKRFA